MKHLSAHYTRREAEGIVLFEGPDVEGMLNSDAEGANRAALGCGGCQASITLHVIARPAAICRCLQLHHAELEYIVNREVPIVRSYPLPSRRP